MLIIGLTGGIGSGKTTVADMFSARGVPVIDADVVARSLVEPGSPAIDEIRADFGDQVLTPNGELDRSAMRELVFADAHKRKRLEAILHPRIRAQMQHEASRAPGPYCLLVIPLLVEVGQQALVDRVLVVDVSVDTQLERVLQRDSLTREQAEAMINSQATREQRLAAADDVIVNNGDLEHLEEQVEKLHEKYLMLTASSG